MVSDALRTPPNLYIYFLTFKTFWYFFSFFDTNNSTVIQEIVIPEIVIPEIVIDFEVIPICANNEEVVNCEADYCLEDSCAAFPLAVGTIDYCGGCSCIWTDILTGLVVECGKRCPSHAP